MPALTGRLWRNLTASHLGGRQPHRRHQLHPDAVQDTIESHVRSGPTLTFLVYSRMMTSVMPLPLCGSSTIEPRLSKSWFTNFTASQILRA